MPRFPLALGATIVLVACATASSSEKSMASENHTSTWCIGHFLVDLPTGARVKVDGSYYNVEVEQQGQAKDFSAIEGSLRKRAAELDAKKTQVPDSPLARKMKVDGYLSVAPTRLLGFTATSEEAVLAYHSTEGSGAFIAELHKLYGNEHYRFQEKHSGAGRYPAVRDALIQTAGRFKPLRPGEVPTSSGFCVGEGLFVEEGRQDVGGRATLYATFPQHPEVKFSVDLSGLHKADNEPSLADRVGGELAHLSSQTQGLNTIRRGKESYGGQLGYEIDISAPRGGGGRIYKYFWSAQGVPKDPLRPFIEAQLITDESAKATLNDEQIDDLWKSMVGSLRLRSER
ncbi:T6SS immunity protein Tli4 family protein [Lysobacter cavernae]|uniref:T6SS immunity protein Tli4 family protein n=1 Tax=Lysobacter cavernae TaxID=1685901 RepID=A0ABV7RQD4_9GAMM